MQGGSITQIPHREPSLYPPEGKNTPVCCTSITELDDGWHDGKIEACMQVVATREAVAMAMRGAWKVSIPG